MTTPIRAFEPLTTQNPMLVLVDHQVGFMTSVRDYSTGELKSTAATRLMWIAKRPALCRDQSYELTDFHDRDG